MANQNQTQNEENTSTMITLALVIGLMSAVSIYSTLLTVKYIDLKNEYKEHLKTHTCQKKQN